MTLVIMATGFAVALLTYSLLILFFSEERTVRTRLDTLSSYESSQAVVAEPTLSPFKSRVVMPAVMWFPRMLRAIAPTSYMDTLQRRLLHAGSPRGLDASRLFALQSFLGVVVATIFGLGRLLNGQTLAASTLAALAGGVAAFMIPHVWISIDRKSTRLNSSHRL